MLSRSGIRGIFDVEYFFDEYENSHEIKNETELKNKNEKKRNLMINYSNGWLITLGCGWKSDAFLLYGYGLRILKTYQFQNCTPSTNPQCDIHSIAVAQFSSFLKKIETKNRNKNHFMSILSHIHTTTTNWG